MTEARLKRPRADRASAVPSPTSRQLRAVEAAVRWYLDTHFGTADDPGVVQNFGDPRRVGAFAINPAAVARRDAEHLFRLLIAVSMFQRRQDKQITRILRGMTEADAAELSSLPALLALSDACECEHGRSLSGLLERCDLTKTPRTKRGTCRANTRVSCHLKRHTVLLRRYGHFGKVPASIALAVRDAGGRDLTHALSLAERAASTPEARARAMIDALSRAWRVSEKISSMFLSLVWNPDLTPGAEERLDLDWRHFIVIDSNVDLFLAAIEYRGPRSYEARRRFIRELSSRIDLQRLKPSLRRDNPRLVQQAMYLLMSASNRRVMAGDCMRLGPSACASCPTALSRICPVRSAKGSKRRLPVIA